MIGPCVMRCLWLPERRNYRAMLSSRCCASILLAALIGLLVWYPVGQHAQAEEIRPVKSLLEMRHRNVTVQEWVLAVVPLP